MVDPLLSRGARSLIGVANPQNRAYIFSQDRLLVESCHILLIVHDLETHSVGTWVELTWARDKGLYTILFVTNPKYTSGDQIGNAFLQRMCDTTIFSDPEREKLRGLLGNFAAWGRKTSLNLYDNI